MSNTISKFYLFYVTANIMIIYVSGKLLFDFQKMLNPSSISTT